MEEGLTEWRERILQRRCAHPATGPAALLAQQLRMPGKALRPSLIGEGAIGCPLTSVGAGVSADGYFSRAKLRDASQHSSFALALRSRSHGSAAAEDAARTTVSARRAAFMQR